MLLTSTPNMSHCHINRYMILLGAVWCAFHAFFAIFRQSVAEIMVYRRAMEKFAVDPHETLILPPNDHHMTKPRETFHQSLVYYHIQEAMVCHVAYWSSCTPFNPNFCSQPPSKSGCRHPKSNHTPTKQGRNAQNPRNFSSKSRLLSWRCDDDKVPGLVHSFWPALTRISANFYALGEKCTLFQRVQAIFLPISPTPGYRAHKTRPGVI